MTCTIIWKVLTVPEYEGNLIKISHPTLLQLPAYGRSASVLGHSTPRYFLIEINGQAAGIAQILGVKALGLQAVMLDRGPMWFEGFGTPEHFTAFAGEFARKFPKRPWCRRRFIPEIPDSESAQKILKQAGFKKHGSAGYETFMIDLTRSEDKLLAAMKPNWRNKLHKAERSAVQIEWSDSAQDLPWFLKEYERDKKEKSYDGPSLRLMVELAKNFAPDKNMLIGKALLDKTPVASILILCHGQGATYQIGWSAQAGRAVSAHHLLLWKSLPVLRHKGIVNFDLGGVNDGKAANIKTFKEGMGGDLLRLPGLYT